MSRHNKLNRTVPASICRASHSNITLTYAHSGELSQHLLRFIVALQIQHGRGVSLHHSARTTSKDNQQRHQQRTRHINNGAQNLGAGAEQVPFSDSTMPGRSEIRGRTHELNVTKVIKVTTDMW